MLKIIDAPNHLGATACGSYDVLDSLYDAVWRLYDLHSDFNAPPDDPLVQPCVRLDWCLAS